MIDNVGGIFEKEMIIFGFVASFTSVTSGLSLVVCNGGRVVCGGEVVRVGEGLVGGVEERGWEGVEAVEGIVDVKGSHRVGELRHNTMLLQHLLLLLLCIVVVVVVVVQKWIVAESAVIMGKNTEKVVRV